MPVANFQVDTLHLLDLIAVLGDDARQNGGLYAVLIDRQDLRCRFAARAVALLVEPRRVGKRGI